MNSTAISVEEASRVAAAEHFIEIDDDAPPLIKPGIYDFRFEYHQTSIMFGKAPKLVLWFTVITFGEYFDTVTLPRYYNVKRLLSKPCKNGRFKVGHKSAFLRDYVRIFHGHVKRLDRLSMSAFHNEIIVGKVKTVTSGADQGKIHDLLQYSVIEELIRAKPL